MVQMLKLMPTMELADMYLSENLEAMFKGVQEKYFKQQEYLRHHDEHGRVLADSADGKGKSPGIAKDTSAGSSGWIWWTVGGIGLAAGVAGGYYLFHEEPGAQPNAKTIGF